MIDIVASEIAIKTDYFEMTNLMELSFVTMTECPLCSKRSAVKELYDLGRFKVYRCACGHKFISPGLDARSMASIYQSSATLAKINPALGKYYEYDSLNPNTKTYQDYDLALRKLAHHALGRDLLEIGCGTGTFLHVARARGWWVTGVDSSAENIRKVREDGMVGFVSVFPDFSTDRKFDAVVMWDLIEHPSDPVSFLRRASMLLRQGGLLLIATPHDPNLLTMIAGWIYRLSGGKISFPLRQFYVWEHSSYFSRETLFRMIHSNGFQILEMWKTETDLERYQFHPLIKLGLIVAFFVARCLQLENRLLLIAQKVS
ncbi:MAG: class I SAM-dependent methyltransferase [Candidatus Omnitrophica bacterium]|nr:class I SAM-dependent methyltransferase [Candidatus Omnitrophota bacterium]